VANHRAPRHSVSSAHAHAEPAPQEREDLTVARASTPGRRKAVKPGRAARKQARRGATTRGAQVAASQTHESENASVPAALGRAHSGSRKKLFPLLPSAPSAIGAMALVVAAGGAVAVADENAGVTETASTKLYTQVSALSGSSEVVSSTALDSRLAAASRDSQRTDLGDAADEELRAAAEAKAKQRNAALAQLAASAEQQAQEIRENAWVLPVSGYEITAEFGYSSSLWSSTHTGLDFAAPYGTPVVSVAGGTVTATDWAGAYGNRVVVTLDDGTEIWYCHLSSFAVSPGQSVDSGDQVGSIGSTGNSTGDHLHLEVRPGAGDPVDPYAALVAHGLQP